MYNELIEKILLQSTAVRTPVLPEVLNTIKDVTVDYQSVKKYKTDIINWLKPIVDLTDFYVYPTNGITEGLNWWNGNEKRSVWCDKGEYQWIEPRTNSESTIVYQSNPSAADGNYVCLKNNSVLALDLAYVGSTRINKIEINKNVDFVFYSLSKSFGVRNIRTGWFFSRKPDKKLEDLIHSAKYYNYYAVDVAEKIINNFDIDFVHSKLYKQQTEICNKLELLPSDSVWLATSEKEEYAKFRRKNNVARICLTGVYEIC